MLREYQFNLTNLVQPIDRLVEKKTKVLWALQEPVNEEKIGIEFQMVTNKQIDLYNKAAIEVNVIFNSRVKNCFYLIEEFYKSGKIRFS